MLSKLCPSLRGQFLWSGGPTCSGLRQRSSRRTFVTTQGPCAAACGLSCSSTGVESQTTRRETAQPPGCVGVTAVPSDMEHFSRE